MTDGTPSEEQREKNRQRQAAYRARHPERIAQRKADHRARNRERMKQKDRDYYAANKDAIREKRQVNADKISEYNRAYFEARPEYKHAWFEANRERHRNYVTTRRGRELENRCDHEVCQRIDRRVVWGRDEGHCRIGTVCGGAFVPFEDMHLDHVMPVSKGGAHCYANVQTACAPCNRSKAAKVSVGGVW